MPRKKQGLRSYHHKSRNGCMQCKNRRVKCTMQAPACANCIRRKEVCEYAGVVDQSTAMTQWHHGLRERYYHDLPGGFSGYAPGSPAFGISSGQPSFPDNAITIDSSIGTLLKSVMGRSWFTPMEAGVWSGAIMRNINKYPYLQHCIVSVSYLRRDIVDNQSKNGISPAAYEHQMAASALFRRGATEVNAETWFATLTFHVYMLIFEFGSQTACPNDHFHLVDTLRVLRSGNAMEESARPYFRASKLWEMVNSRCPPQDQEVDPSLRTNLRALGGVIADTAVSDIKKAGVNSKALTELNRWVVSCHAHPRRWDQYCDWPGHVDDAFLDLLPEDEVALLIVIHWAAVIYRSPKPPVFHWAKRVAMYALGRLEQREKWESLLVWPLQVLQVSKNPQMDMMAKGEHDKMLEVSKSLAAMKISEDAHFDVSLPISSGGWHPEPMASSSRNDPLTSNTTHSSISATSSPYNSSLLVPGGEFEQSRSTSPYDTTLAISGESFESYWPTSSGDIYYATSSSSPESIPIDPSLLQMDQAEQTNIERSQSPAPEYDMGIGLDLYA